MVLVLFCTISVLVTFPTGTKQKQFGEGRMYSLRPPPITRERHSGRSWRQLLTAPEVRRQGETDCGCAAGFLIFIQSRTPATAMVLLIFRVSLPTSTQSGNSFVDIPRAHLLGDPRYFYTETLHESSRFHFACFLWVLFYINLYFNFYDGKEPTFQPTVIQPATTKKPLLAWP